MTAKYDPTLDMRALDRTTSNYPRPPVEAPDAAPLLTPAARVLEERQTALAGLSQVAGGVHHEIQAAEHALGWLVSSYHSRSGGIPPSEAALVWAALRTGILKQLGLLEDPPDDDGEPVL